MDYYRVPIPNMFFLPFSYSFTDQTDEEPYFAAARNCK